MKGDARLFVGVPVSMAAIQALTEAARALRESTEEAGMKVRWVPPANYHVTLKFLGWTRGDVFGAVRETLARIMAGVEQFEFRIAGVGAFPKPGKARVLWAGIDDPTGTLSRLADAADTALAELGFPTEQHPFRPHVTLGRLGRPADVRDLLDPLSEREFSKNRGESAILFESTINPEGSKYVQRAEFALERPAQRAKRQTGRLKRSRDQEEE